jgi:hypothetical protein
VTLYDRHRGAWARAGWRPLSRFEFTLPVEARAALIVEANADHFGTPHVGEAETVERMLVSGNWTGAVKRAIRLARHLRSSHDSE